MNNWQTLGTGIILLLISAGGYKTFGGNILPSNNQQPIINNILPSNPNSKYCTVKPGSIYDGDTMRVLCNGEEIKVRFCGIDAPEKKQARGIESRDYLRSLLPDNAQVIVIPIEKDRYGRLVAEIWNDAINGENYINGNMVLAGMAWHYEKYSSNCSDRQALTTAELLAKQNNLGVHADPNSIKPWNWRKQNK